jgi:8-oxo-dGTP pyrophosphatase MutT (NUDIX family)
MEVFLTRRRPELRFLGGYTVFPGGRVDAADYTTAKRLTGINPRCAGRFTGVSSSLALAHWVAAFRELHEEIGLWLGDGPEPREATWHEDVGSHAFLPARRLCYVDHWITPPWVPIRFDTRFFVAEVDGDPAFRLHPAEIDEAAWMTPADALAAADVNKMQLIKPTITLLRTLAAFGTVKQMRQVWRGLGRRTDPVLASSREDVALSPSATVATSGTLSPSAPAGGTEVQS